MKRVIFGLIAALGLALTTGCQCCGYGGCCGSNGCGLFGSDSTSYSSPTAPPTTVP